MYIVKDGNGFIDNEEIDGFLKDLLELVKEVRTDISQYLYSLA